MTEGDGPLDGIAELMQEANIDVITRQGLSDELASDQDDAITNRYAVARGESDEEDV